MSEPNRLEIEIEYLGLLTGDLVTIAHSLSLYQAALKEINSRIEKNSNNVSCGIRVSSGRVYVKFSTTYNGDEWNSEVDAKKRIETTRNFFVDIAGRPAYSGSS